jgi:hypothetical protein
MGVKLGRSHWGRYHRLRVYENRVLKRIFRSKKDEITGEWRRLHKEGLYALYSSSNTFASDQIKTNEMDRACSKYGRLEMCIQDSGGET